MSSRFERGEWGFLCGKSYHKSLLEVTLFFVYIKKKQTHLHFLMGLFIKQRTYSIVNYIYLHVLDAAGTKQVISSPSFPEMLWSISTGGGGEKVPAVGKDVHVR